MRRWLARRRKLGQRWYQGWPLPTGVALVVGVVVVVVATRYGSDTGTDTAGASLTTTTTAPTTTTTRPPVREGCVADLLAAAAQGEYPSSTVADQACSSTYAIGTVDGPTTDPIVGFFVIGPDGRWVLVQVGEIDGDQYAEAPEGLPDSLVNTWRRAYGIRSEQEEAQRRAEAEAAAQQQAYLDELRRQEEERLALEALNQALQQATSTTVPGTPPAPAP